MIRDTTAKPSSRNAGEGGAHRAAMGEGEGSSDGITLTPSPGCARSHPLPASGARGLTMFTKILIANRGEIACRVIRTCATHGHQDRRGVFRGRCRGAPCADGGRGGGDRPAAGRRELFADRGQDRRRVQGATKAQRRCTRATASFSERPAFAERAGQAEGIAFIGPTPEAIAAMGDKIESKKLAAAAGVTTVPGYLGVIADTGEAARIAHQIGYPVMIKASAGGGGKGMRIAHDDTELREGFSSAQHEAKASFGDDRVFLEKYIEEPRHIENSGAGRRARPCRASRRARMLDPAAPPEGHRGVSTSRVPRSRDARG